MFLLQMKEKIVVLWTLIKHSFSQIINLFHNHFVAYDLQKEIRELNQVVSMFFMSITNSLNITEQQHGVVPAPNQNANNEVKSAQSDDLEKIPSLEELRTIIHNYNERSMVGRAWNYMTTSIRSDRPIYAGKFLIALTESLTQENKEDACTQFLNLCDRHLGFIGLEEDLLHNIHSACSKIKDILEQLKTQTARLSNIEKFLNKLSQALTNSEEIVFVKAIYYYSRIWYEYPDFEATGLKSVQKLMKLKLHPDKNPEHLKDAANNAYLRFCNINETERHQDMDMTARDQDRAAYKKYLADKIAANEKKKAEQFLVEEQRKAEIIAVYEKQITELGVIFEAKMDKITQDLIDGINNNSILLNEDAARSKLLGELQALLHPNDPEQNKFKSGVMDAVMAEVMVEVIEETIDSNSFAFREGIDCSKLLLGLNLMHKHAAAKQNNVTDQEALPQQHNELKEESDSSSSLIFRM